MQIEEASNANQRDSFYFQLDKKAHNVNTETLQSWLFQVAVKYFFGKLILYMYLGGPAVRDCFTTFFSNDSPKLIRDFILQGRNNISYHHYFPKSTNSSF